MNQPNQRPSRDEEPEITQEEDVAVDGRDTEGEEMMKEVNNPKREQKPEEGSGRGRRCRRSRSC